MIITANSINVAVIMQIGSFINLNAINILALKKENVEKKKQQ